MARRLPPAPQGKPKPLVTAHGNARRRAFAFAIGTSLACRTSTGGSVRRKVVGKATSSGSGSYAIHPSVTLPKGIHNLEVLAHSSVAVGAFSFPRKVARGALVAVDGSASTGPVTANIHMMALPKSALSA